MRTALTRWLELGSDFFPFGVFHCTQSKILSIFIPQNVIFFNQIDQLLVFEWHFHPRLKPTYVCCLWINFRRNFEWKKWTKNSINIRRSQWFALLTVLRSGVDWNGMPWEPTFLNWKPTLSVDKTQRYRTTLSVIINRFLSEFWPQKHFRSSSYFCF